LRYVRDTKICDLNANKCDSLAGIFNALKRQQDYRNIGSQHLLDSCAEPFSLNRTKRMKVSVVMLISSKTRATSGWLNGSRWENLNIWPKLRFCESEFLSRSPCDGDDSFHRWSELQRRLMNCIARKLL